MLKSGLIKNIVAKRIKTQEFLYFTRASILVIDECKENITGGR